MNKVYPIRDPEVVAEIAQWFKKRNERDYIMFLLGIYLGRRISDILKLRVKDVKDKDAINIKEQKTGKICRLNFNPELRRALKEYCKDLEGDEYLLKSRKGENKPINRCTAYSILREAADWFGIPNIGTHSMRKTFAYHIYMDNNKDVALVMTALGHSTESETLKYIGVEKEQLNRAIRRLNFKTKRT